jgi:hypothetical protein
VSVRAPQVRRIALRSKLNTNCETISICWPRFSISQPFQFGHSGAVGVYAGFMGSAALFVSEGFRADPPWASLRPSKRRENPIARAKSVTTPQAQVGVITGLSHWKIT